MNKFPVRTMRAFMHAKVEVASSSLAVRSNFLVIAGPDGLCVAALPGDPGGRPVATRPERSCGRHREAPLGAHVVARGIHREADQDDCGSTGHWRALLAVNQASLVAVAVQLCLDPPLFQRTCPRLRLRKALFMSVVQWQDRGLQNRRWGFESLPTCQFCCSRWRIVQRQNAWLLTRMSQVRSLLRQPIQRLPQDRRVRSACLPQARPRIGVFDHQLAPSPRGRWRPPVERDNTGSNPVGAANCIMHVDIGMHESTRQSWPELSGVLRIGPPLWVSREPRATGSAM